MSAKTFEGFAREYLAAWQEDEGKRSMREMARTAWDAAYRAGAEEMRERAAGVVDVTVVETEEGDEISLASVASRIRALPVESGGRECRCTRHSSLCGPDDPCCDACYSRAPAPRAEEPPPTWRTGPVLDVCECGHARAVHLLTRCSVLEGPPCGCPAWRPAPSTGEGEP